MATTTNYGWTTPDDTALVKDGAAAIRSLGTAIDTSFAADEGDLLVGGTSDIFEALPIGAAGTVLTSDGDTAEWAAPAGGSQTWTLLNAGGTALTGAATITVSGISNVNEILIIFTAASSVNASSTAQLRLNTDTGNNYTSAGIFAEFSNVYSANDFNGTSAIDANLIALSRMSGTAASGNVGSVYIQNCNSTSYKIFRSNASGTANGDATHIARSLQGFYKGTSTISSVSLISSSGNWDNGTLYVYGA